jgi:hypothetical protein
MKAGFRAEMDAFDGRHKCGCGAVLVPELHRPLPPAGIELDPDDECYCNAGNRCI